MKKILMSIIFCVVIFTSSYNIASTEQTLEGSPITNPSELNIDTNCVLLVEKDTGDILYEKNAYEKMYPASTTKMLTAILVLEKCNLNEIVTVSQSALSAVPYSYTTAHLQAGEQFSVDELLHAMLIPSANDAANVLAEYVSGSIENFANLMNEKAREIGLENSHFTNPSRNSR